MIVESKLGEMTPDEYFDFNYHIIRRDRVAGSGGLIIFLKKDYKIISTTIYSDYEVISFTVKIKHRLVNFIVGYNPHFEYAETFNAHLEMVLARVKHNHPTYIIGDLNQDLLTPKGDRLKNLLDNFGFQMEYQVPTHSQGKTLSCIDIVACNDPEFTISSQVSPCPFSNHYFVHTTCSLDSLNPHYSQKKARVLNDRNLEAIRLLVENCSFEFLEIFDDVNDKWFGFKNIISNIINEVAPLKQFRMKKVNNLPWIDGECKHLMQKRDRAHEKAISITSNRSTAVWDEFRLLRNKVKSLIRLKMNLYFENKDTKFFKNSKNFWKFYKKFIKSKKNGSTINSIKLENGRILDSEQSIAYEFNNFISRLNAPPIISDEDSKSYIQRNFNTF